MSKFLVISLYLSNLYNKNPEWKLWYQIYRNSISFRSKTKIEATSRNFFTIQPNIGVKNQSVCENLLFKERPMTSSGLLKAIDNDNDDVVKSRKLRD